jgi:sulfite exporter TauE/SafE
MTVFWLGTLPVMATLGVGVARLAGPLRRHVPVLCAVALVVVGILAVTGRLRAIEPIGPGGTAPAAHHHGGR